MGLVRTTGANNGQIQKAGDILTQKSECESGLAIGGQQCETSQRMPNFFLALFKRERV